MSKNKLFLGSWDLSNWWLCYGQFGDRNDINELNNEISLLDLDWTHRIGKKRLIKINWDQL